MLTKLLDLVPEKLLWQGAKRYIAGTDVDDAVRVVRQLNDIGATATVSFLGERVTTDREADGMLNEYLRLISVIIDERLEAYVSVKPTSLGLEIGYGRYLERLRCLTAESTLGAPFIRLDMEGSSYVDRTLQSFFQVRQRHVNLGVALQAYLHRSIDDAERVAREGADVRLCKGAYREKRGAYQSRFEIQRSFIRILRTLLKGHGFVAIATHDEQLIGIAERLIRGLRIPPERYCFEMLYGVREERRAALIAAGHPVCVYVPYGKDWRAYVLRRFHENPSLWWTIARAMLLGK